MPQRRARAGARDRPVDLRAAARQVTPSRARRARARDRRLPALPAAGRVARGGRARQAGVVRRSGLLGQAGARLRRPGRERRRARAGAGRARRQPDRAGVHRRPLRRLAVRGAVAGGLREPAGVGRDRRWPAADATAGSRLPSAARHRPTSRLRSSATPACRTVARELELLADARVIVCLGAFAWDAALRTLGPVRAAAAVRARRRGERRRLHAARLLPRQSAEHVHRQADRADARRDLRAGGRGRAWDIRDV